MGEAVALGYQVSQEAVQGETGERVLALEKGQNLQWTF